MTETINDTRTYKLITNNKPISWKLRTNNIFQNRTVDGKQIGLRQLVYVMGGHSIWREDYPKDSQLKFKPIWFERGILRVPKRDPLFVGYLESHPDWNVKFKLDDPEGDAKRKLEKLEKLDEVKSLLNKLEDYSALAIALSGNPAPIMQLTYSEKKLRCYEAASTDPTRVLKALSDPKTETTYYVMLAFSRNVLSVNPSKSDILWGKTREIIMPIPTGKKPVPAVVDYIVDEKGDDLFLQITKKLKGLSQVNNGKSKK